MNMIEAYHLLKAAYPDLSRQNGRAILRALVQQVGKIDEAASAITRLVPDPLLANKMIASIRNDFAHKSVVDARQAQKASYGGPQHDA